MCRQNQGSTQVARGGASVIRGFTFLWRGKPWGIVQSFLDEVQLRAKAARLSDTKIIGTKQERILHTRLSWDFIETLLNFVFHGVRPNPAKVLMVAPHRGDRNTDPGQWQRDPGNSSSFRQQAGWSQRY